jgi:hypothetical protein
MRSRSVFVSLAVLALAALAAVPAAAQGQWIYSVDFVCGFQASQDGSAGYEPLVKVANYATKVDVHNYGATSVTLSASAALTSTKRWPAAATPVPLALATLGADGSSVIDCAHVAQALLGQIPAGKPFLNGVIVVKSAQPLVVWATKTTEVCAGYATYVNWATGPFAIFIDPDGVAHFGGPGGPIVPAGNVVFGCPVAQVDLSGNVIPPVGPFLGPGGAVPPGLRIPSDTVGSTSFGDRVAHASPVSISNAIDFERVEGVQLP